MKRNLRYWLALGIFIVSLISNLIIAARNTVGYADSDEIIVSAHLLTPAHPPGYGLDIILIGIFQRVLSPFGISPAFSSNIFAGILHSLTLSILFLSSYTLFMHKRKEFTGDIAFYGAWGVMALGWNALYWLYSGIIEVMSLGDVFVSLFIYLSVVWITNKEINRLVVVLCALIFGMGVSHLQSLILCGPSLLYFLLSHRGLRSYKQKITVFLVVVCISSFSFLVSSGLLLFLNARKQPFAWDFNQSISGLWSMIIRNDYKGNFANKNLTVDNQYVYWNALIKIDAIPTYVITMWNHMGGLPLIFPIFGIIWLLRKNKQWSYGLIGMYVIAGVFFSMYITLTNPGDTLVNRYIQGIYQRQYLIGYTILGFFSCLGCMYISEFLIERLVNKYSVRSILACVIILPLIAEAFANYEMANHRNDSVVDALTQDMLYSAEPNSVIICSSDIICFNLYYQSLVSNIRPDVVVLSSIPRARKYFLENHLEYIGTAVPYLPEFLKQEVTWNVSKRPTYMVLPDDYFKKYIGLNGNPYYLIPHGLMFKVSLTPEKEKPQLFDGTFYSRVLKQSVSNRDFIGLSFRDFGAQLYLVQSKAFASLNLYESALTSLDKALSLNNSNKTIKQWQQRLQSL